MNPTQPDPLEHLAWDEHQRRWCGVIELAPGRQIEVLVQASRPDPAVSLALAKLVFPIIAPRIDDARRLAAHQLLDYYNVFNAHLKEGEHLTAREFADRLELEAIRFTAKGSSVLDFQHRLYRGYRNLEGGLVVVMVRFDGRFRKAAWMTSADAEELRSLRCCDPPPTVVPARGHGEL